MEKRTSMYSGSINDGGGIYGLNEGYKGINLDSQVACRVRLQQWKCDYYIYGIIFRQSECHCPGEEPSFSRMAKHVDIRHHFIREAIQDKIIWVQYIPTTEMTVDSLTKALSCEKREKCAARMGLTP